MRLTDLLSAEVVDSDGEHLGRVQDVALVRDGPMLGTFISAYRVHGLRVGKMPLGSRLGYSTGNVTAPFLLRILFERLHRDELFIPWEEVHNAVPGRISTHSLAEALRNPNEVPE